MKSEVLMNYSTLHDTLRKMMYLTELAEIAATCCNYIVNLQQIAAIHQFLAVNAWSSIKSFYVHSDKLRL